MLTCKGNGWKKVGREVKCGRVEETQKVACVKWNLKTQGLAKAASEMRGKKKHTQVNKTQQSGNKTGESGQRWTAVRRERERKDHDLGS